MYDLLKTILDIILVVKKGKIVPTFDIFTYFQKINMNLHSARVSFHVEFSFVLYYYFSCICL